MQRTGKSTVRKVPTGQRDGAAFKKSLPHRRISASSPGRFQSHADTCGGENLRCDRIKYASALEQLLYLNCALPEGCELSQIAERSSADVPPNFGSGDHILRLTFHRGNLRDKP